MRILSSAMTATILLAFTSIPQVAHACVAYYTDYNVDSAESEIEAWDWVGDFYSIPPCFYDAYYQWGYWEHTYTASVDIQSPTLNSASDSTVVWNIPYGGDDASASATISTQNDYGNYVIDWLLRITCLVGGEFVEEEDEEVVPCPMPPYLWHKPKFTSEPPTVTKSGILAMGTLTISSKIFTDQLTFDRFEEWVEETVEKTVAEGGVNVQIVVNLERVALPELADLVVTRTLIQPPGGGHPRPADCGSHTTAFPGDPHEIEVFDDGDGSSGCDEAKAGGHEFLHHLGFDDAYFEPYPGTSHCDITDIMAWGNQLHEYHVRILWEEN